MKIDIPEICTPVKKREPNQDTVHVYTWVSDFDGYKAAKQRIVLRQCSPLRYHSDVNGNAVSKVITIERFDYDACGASYWRAVRQLRYVQPAEKDGYWGAFPHEPKSAGLSFMAQVLEEITISQGECIRERGIPVIPKEVQAS